MGGLVFDSCAKVLEEQENEKEENKNKLQEEKERKRNSRGLVKGNLVSFLQRKNQPAANAEPTELAQHLIEYFLPFLHKKKMLNDSEYSKRYPTAASRGH